MGKKGFSRFHSQRVIKVITEFCKVFGSFKLFPPQVWHSIMLKMQFIQKVALINVRWLIRIGLLPLLKIMFLCKNMPCASTTQLTKPSWSALKRWRHFVCFLANVEMSIFPSLGRTRNRLGGQRQEGYGAVTLPLSLTTPRTVHSHPHHALAPLAGTHKSNSPRAGTTARVVPM